MADSAPEGDRVLPALTELCEAAQRCAGHVELILERARTIRGQRASGLSYEEIVERETRPLIVELLTASMTELSEAGSRWRREEARALYEEGLSMDRIAQLFGVSRQRISTLLRASAPTDEHPRDE